MHLCGCSGEGVLVKERGKRRSSQAAWAAAEAQYKERIKEEKADGEKRLAEGQARLPDF